MVIFEGGKLMIFEFFSLRCEQCESESILCQGEFCPHLRSKHSADDQVLISSLLALAGEPSAIQGNEIDY